MKLLILTTEKKTLDWKSLNIKLWHIQEALDSGKNADFDVEIKYIDVKPKVVKGRVDHDWLLANNKPYFSQGYDLIGLHMSRKQWANWGLIESLRGSNPRDKSEQEDFYFSADEKNKRNGEDRFVQVCLHETAHAYYQTTGETDITHAWHDRNPDISGLFKLMDWSKYQPDRMRLRKKVSLLERLLELIGLKNRLESKNEPQKPILPVPFLRITQEYGVYNPSLYPSTNYHWGLDLRASLGTPIKAPLDGQIIEVGYSKALGHWVQFYADDRYFIIPHMAKTTQVGKYKQGDVIGNVGNTGFMTAVHFHIEVWKVRMVNRITQLKEEGWEVTEDPKEYFGL